MRRPLVIGCWCICIGALFGSMCSAVQLFAAAVAAVLILLVCLAVTLYKHKQLRRVWLVLLYGMLFVTSGWRAMHLLDQSIAVLKPFDEKTVTLCGEVVKIEQEGSAFSVRMGWIEDENQRVDCNLTVAVQSYGGQKVDMMDTVVVQGIFKMPTAAGFYGDFNNLTYQASRGNWGTLITGRVTVQPRRVSPIHARVLMYRLRTAMIHRVDGAIGGAGGGLLKGILLGERGDFDTEMLGDLSRSGLAHITAVSGENVSIYLACLALILPMASRHRWRDLVLTWVAVLFYICLVGGEPSVMRAGVMVMLLMLFLALRWRQDTFQTLMLATGALVFAYPLLVCNTGFQLSFLATMGMVLYTPYFSGSRIVRGFALTAGSFLLIMPVMGYSFNIISFATFFANILAAPLVVMLLPLGYLLCLLPFLAVPLGWMLNAFLWIAKQFAGMNFLAVPVSSLGIGFFLCYGLGLRLLYVMIRRRTKEAILTGAVLVMATAVLFVPSILPARSDTLTMIDCGGERLVHLQTAQRQNVFVGAGAYQQDYPCNLRNYCVKQGISQVDLIVIPEDDAEQFGGLIDLLDHVPVKQVYLPQEVRYGTSQTHVALYKKLEKTTVCYYNDNDLWLDVRIEAPTFWIDPEHKLLTCRGIAVSWDPSQLQPGTRQYKIDNHGMVAQR